MLNPNQADQKPGKAFLRRRSTRALALVLALVVLLAVPVCGMKAAAAGAVSEDDLNLISGIINYVQGAFYKEVDQRTLVQGALRGILASLGDPHSEFLTQEDYESLMGSVSGTFGGIGIVITAEEGYVIVISPIKGTPAYGAGLQTGDRILKANDQDLAGATADEASRIIRGDPGTVVTLLIQRVGVPQPFEVKITRAMINVDPVETSFRQSDGIAVIKVNEFNDHTTTRLDMALIEAQKEDARGIILDLRGNPGGYLYQAISVVSRFVRPGNVVVRLVGQDSEETMDTTESPVFETKPMVLLVDGGSASASEIVAGALKDYGVATLVGNRTYGKGTVQSIFQIQTGDGIRMTTARFATPNRRFIDGQGVEPDVVVDMPQFTGKTYPQGFLDGKRTLTNGTVGLDVLALQEALTFMGYYSGPQDGVFSKAVGTAVADFQAESKLTVTRTVNDAVASAIRQAVNNSIRTPKVDPQMEKAVSVLKAKMGN